MRNLGRLTKHPAIRILLAFITGVAVLFASTFLIDELVAANRYLRQLPLMGRTARHTTMLILSLLFILLLNKGSFKGYGFRWSKRLHIFLMIGIGLILSLGVNWLALFFQFQPRTAFGFAGVHLVDKVLYLWLWTSISEEVFTRGLIQGYLSPLQSLGFRLSGITLSLPVLVGAIFFGGMHLVLLTIGISPARVLYLVLATTLLGVFAGYHKERTNSLAAPVIIHFSFNMGGSLFQMLLSV